MLHSKFAPNAHICSQTFLVCTKCSGLIRHLSTEENADTFVPVLIYVVLRANPDNLISNVE